MIKIVVDNKAGNIELEINGKYLEIISNVTMAVRLVYEQLCKRDEQAGERFKNDFKNAVKKDLMFLTAEELTQRAKESFEKLKKELEDNIGIIDDIVSEDESDKNKKGGSQITNVFLGEV